MHVAASVAMVRALVVAAEERATAAGGEAVGSRMALGEAFDEDRGIPADTANIEIDRSIYESGGFGRCEGRRPAWRV
jgi:hypothetical protein